MLPRGVPSATETSERRNGSRASFSAAFKRYTETPGNAQTRRLVFIMHSLSCLSITGRAACLLFPNFNLIRCPVAAPDPLCTVRRRVVGFEYHVEYEWYLFENNALGCYAVLTLLGKQGIISAFCWQNLVSPPLPSNIINNTYNTYNYGGNGKTVIFIAICKMFYLLNSWSVVTWSSSQKHLWRSPSFTKTPWHADPGSPWGSASGRRLRAAQDFIF